MSNAANFCSEDNKQRTVSVLVITDPFTKFAHAFLCPNLTAKQVSRKLWDKVFCIYGFLEIIHSDQGANIESKFITTPQLPQGFKSHKQLLTMLWETAKQRGSTGCFAVWYMPYVLRKNIWHSRVDLCLQHNHPCNDWIHPILLNEWLSP